MEVKVSEHAPGVFARLRGAFGVCSEDVAAATNDAVRPRVVIESKDMFVGAVGLRTLEP